MAQQTQISHQAAWFVLVGAAAAAVHFGILVLLVQWAGVAPAWANVAAFVVALCVSFGGHFCLTFRQPGQHRSWLRSLWRWLASSVGGFALNQLLFVVGLYWFGRHAYVPVWLAVTLLVTLATFALGKFWAFRHTDGTA